MNRPACFIAGVVLGAVLVFVGLKFHVVRAEDGFHAVPKMAANFSEAYVDVREFKVSDWNEHRSLAVALVQADKGHLIKDSASSTLMNTLNSALDVLGRK